MLVCVHLHNFSASLLVTPRVGLKCNDTTAFNWCTLKHTSSSSTNRNLGVVGRTGGKLWKKKIPDTTEKRSSRREEEPRYSCPHLVLRFFFFLGLFIFFLFCGFVNEVCVCVYGGERKARSCVKPLCWHQRKRKRERGRKKRKRPKDEAALKNNRALAAAGATTRVQAQRCNKGEGGWMRERGREGVVVVWWEGGGAAMSLLWCVFVLCATQLLPHTHIYTQLRRVIWKSSRRENRAAQETHKRAHTHVKQAFILLTFDDLQKLFFSFFFFFLHLPFLFPKWEVMSGMQREVSSANRGGEKVDVFESADMSWVLTSV